MRAPCWRVSGRPVSTSVVPFVSRAVLRLPGQHRPGKTAGCEVLAEKRDEKKLREASAAMVVRTAIQRVRTARNAGHFEKIPDNRLQLQGALVQ